MSPKPPASMGLEDARWPDDDDWPEDDSDDDWPEDDETDDEAHGPPWPPGPPGTARPGAAGPPRQGGTRPPVVAAVAVVALAVGGGVAALVARGAPASSPSATQPTGGTQPGGVPGNGGGFPGGQVGRLLLGGKVVAVSSTSITIAGGSHTVTAAVTSSTQVTGKVNTIGAVKVGDLVSAQITVSGGKTTATAIQDPARLPSSGGGLPPNGGSQP